MWPASGQAIFSWIFSKTICKEKFPSDVIATVCLSHAHNGRIKAGEKKSEEFLISSWQSTALMSKTLNE